MKTYAPPTITLRIDLLSEAQRIKALLDNHCNGDIELWCEQLGFHYFRDDNFLVRKPSLSYVRGKTIYIRGDLMRDAAIKAIAHEYCHSKYHPDCVQFSDAHIFDAGRNEGQAIAFSEAVLNH